MLNKLIKALPLILYLIKAIIRFDDEQNQKEKKDNVQKT